MIDIKDKVNKVVITVVNVAVIILQLYHGL